MATSKIHVGVKSVPFSGTTGGTGIVSAGVDSTERILNAVVGEYIALPLKVDSYWRLKILNRGDLTAVANTSVSGTIYIA